LHSFYRLKFQEDKKKYKILLRSPLEKQFLLYSFSTTQGKLLITPLASTVRVRMLLQLHPQLRTKASIERFIVSIADKYAAIGDGIMRKTKAAELHIKSNAVISYGPH
jgi:hypothetical protein